MKQYSTFYISGRIYGIDVKLVQEVVRPMPMTRIPLAPSYVRGLINLRGQVATAVGLRELFSLEDKAPAELMNVVCRIDGSLVSLLVDEIGDVIEVSDSDYEHAPPTVPDSVRRFMSGIYKIPGKILSIIDIDEVSSYLNGKVANNESQAG